MKSEGKLGLEIFLSRLSGLGMRYWHSDGVLEAFGLEVYIYRCRFRHLGLVSDYVSAPCVLRSYSLSAFVEARVRDCCTYNNSMLDHQIRSTKQS